MPNSLSNPLPNIHFANSFNSAQPLFSMRIMKLFPLLTSCLFSLTLLGGQAIGATATQTDDAPIKYKVKLPPSATLLYTIKAKQRGFPLSGESKLSFQSDGNNYQIGNEVKASLIGKIQESKSNGQIDKFGLAPLQFIEKRYRKDPTTTDFNREENQISFTESDLRYPIRGGEQDRISVIWQLIGVARSNSEKFIPGSEWTFFVAGRRDAEAWKFKVVQQENIETPMGKLPALHMSKQAPADSKDQQLDIWLAPSMNWYPLRLRFSDVDGDFIEQNLEKIEK